MRKATLFVDESGKSSLVEKSAEPFILTGVIVEESEIVPIEGFFNYIKRKFSINTEIPFHSFDIFENLTTKKLTDREAGSLTSSIAEFISLIPIKICIVAIDKADFKKALGARSDNDFKGSSERKEMREYPYRIMSSVLFKWFADYLEKQNAVGEIVVDARRGGDYQLIKSLYASKDPNGVFDTKTANLIKERCTAICFAEKKYLSGGLEITDLISYTSFFNAKRSMSSMRHIGLNKTWNKIKEKLENNRLDQLSLREIRRFFKVGSDGVHKYLK